MKDPLEALLTNKTANRVIAIMGGIVGTFVALKLFHPKVRYLP